MFKLYNYVTARISNKKNKDRAFRRVLDKMRVAHDVDGKPNRIGKGAYKLHKTFGGKQIDMDTAIKELNNAYNYPADRPRRAQKAQTRNDTIDKISEI